MARKTTSSQSKSTRKSVSKTKAAGDRILAWQDDPISKLSTIELPVPNLAKAPLKLRIKEAAVKPAPPFGTHRQGQS